MEEVSQILDILQVNKSIIHNVTAINLLTNPEIKILIPEERDCVYCKGFGFIDFKEHPCVRCEGLGVIVEEIVRENVTGSFPDFCVDCQGTGVDRRYQRFCCVKCQCTGKMKVKNSCVVRPKDLSPLTIQQFQVSFNLVRSDPYYLSDDYKLCYSITIGLTEVFCGFRRHFIHPKHHNTILFFSRGFVVDPNYYYCIANQGFNGSPLFVRFTIIYPETIGKIPRKSMFTWRNLETLIGQRYQPDLSINCCNITMIDLSTTDKILI